MRSIQIRREIYILLKKDIQSVYKEVFQEAVDSYNKKTKRKEPQRFKITMRKSKKAKRHEQRDNSCSDWGR